MKSSEAFKKTYGGGYHRIDVADGFTFDPNKHSAATITLTDALSTGSLAMNLTAMTNGDTFRMIINAAVTLTATGQTMYPTSFTGYGIVEFEMIDGYVYSSAGADAAIDALQTTIGTYSGASNISTDLGGLMATKIVVGTTPSVCTTAAYKRFGTAANHLKLTARVPGTVGNGWTLVDTGSSVSNLTCSAFANLASKLVTLRYATNDKADSVSISAAALASVLNRDAVSNYFLTTVSGSISKFGVGKGFIDFAGTTASGANNGTVAAMGKIYISKELDKLSVCVSAADGSQVSNANYFKSVSLA